MARSHIGLQAVALVLVGLALAACGGGSGSRQGREPAVGVIQVVTDPRQIVLPLDDYELGIRDTVSVDRAINKLASKCLARFGFDFDIPFNERDVSGPQITHNRLYGLLDEKTAAAYGYHPAPVVHEKSASKTDATTDNPLTHTPEFANVLGAKKGGGIYNGIRIPEGGCYGEARRHVAEGGLAFDPGLPEMLSGESWNRAENDSRVHTAYAKWSECMAKKGFRYRSSRDANNDTRWSGNRASGAEIAVATADVACKKETNLVGVRMAVDTAYQLELIEQHAEALDAVKKGHERQLRNAADILAAS